MHTRYASLDFLRGIACLFIVSFHYLRSYEDPQIIHLIEFGRIGTDIFFVVSGFICAISIRSIISGKYSITDFVKIRFVRIYLLFLLSVLAAALIIPYITALPAYLKSGSFEPDVFNYSFKEWVTFITLFNIFTVDSWELFTAFTPLNGSYWFIAVLLQMYVFTAIALHFKNYQLILISAAIFSTIMQLIPSLKEAVYYGLFIDRYYSFFLGMLAFYFTTKITLSTLTSALMICTGLVFALLSYNANFSEPILRLIWSVCAASILIGLLAFEGVVSTSLITKLFVFIGSFSFSVYLLHVPLFQFADMIGRNITNWEHELYAPFIGVPTIIVMCFLWSKTVEKYAMHMFKRAR